MELLDFADRYEWGAPYDDIFEEEAVGRYLEVISELSGEITGARSARHSRG